MEQKKIGFWKDTLRNSIYLAIFLILISLLAGGIFNTMWYLGLYDGLKYGILGVFIVLVGGFILSIILTPLIRWFKKIGWIKPAKEQKQEEIKKDNKKLPPGVYLGLALLLIYIILRKFNLNLAYAFSDIIDILFFKLFIVFLMIMFFLYVVSKIRGQ